MNKLTFITRLLPVCSLLCSFTLNGASSKTAIYASGNDTTHVCVRPYQDDPEPFECFVIYMFLLGKIFVSLSVVLV